MPESTPLERARDRFVADARALAPGAEDARLAALRAEALEHFAASGLPTTRQEEWRYTNVAPLARLEPGLAPADAPPPAERLDAAALLAGAPRAVLVDGRYAPELSTAGSEVAGIAELRHRDPERLALLGRIASPKAHPFAALNTAFLDDGLAISLDADRDDQAPLYVVLVSSGLATVAAHPRLLVVAAAHARARVVVDHLSLGDAPGLTNLVTEVCVGPGADVDLTLVQREHAEHFHVSGLHVEQRRASRFSSRTLTLGGAWVRNDLSLRLAEEGAECQAHGLFVGSDSQLVDNHTEIDHAVPHCTSDELYKGLLGGSSRGVFRGRVVVRPHAQHTAATQSNPNLLLGRGAEIDSKPQLEIYADDVKCSHGSTIGQLDSDALFYLQTRGIDAAAARELLTRAFAAEIVDALPATELIAALEPRVRERLRAAQQETNP